MSARRAATAFLEWWGEPTPRWAVMAGVPLAVALATLLVWQLVGGQDAPEWVDQASLGLLLWGLMPIMLGGWIHAYVRVYRRAGHIGA